MAVELTVSSIDKLCNGTPVQQPIVQLLGYEAVKMKNNTTHYRLVLSDGVHMNSYFYLSSQLNCTISEKQIKYGTILKIDKYIFTDGENTNDNSPRWIVLIQKITVLIHRNVFGNPQPLTNITKKIKPLINLNYSSSCSSQKLYCIDQLETNLINGDDLNKLPNGNCSNVLKLTVVQKYPIRTFSHCQVLNMNMVDAAGVMLRVSAFNSLADKINNIFEMYKTYYIADTILKRNALNELKIQSYSVIIESLNQIKPLEPSKNTYDFMTLLEKNINTFCDLVGVCTDVSDIEVCSNSSAQTEIAKREITLVDTSMATITLKVWGENVNKFDQKFDDPPVIMVKEAVLKQFNGAKYFSMVKSSVLLVNPNTEEARSIKEWYKETLNDLQHNTFI